MTSWRSMTKIAGSGSISKRHGSADPDPHQNVMDPQHWFYVPGMTSCRCPLSPADPPASCCCLRPVTSSPPGQSYTLILYVKIGIFPVVIYLFLSYVPGKVADPHHFNADPDTSCYFNASPDLAVHFNADPDSAFHFTADSDIAPHQRDENMRSLVYL